MQQTGRPGGGHRHGDDQGAPMHSGLPPPLGRGGRHDRRADSDRAVEILSHELRSPMTAIHLGTRVLRDADRRITAPVRAAVVEAVGEEAERLYRLVEDLLAVARYDGGRPLLPGRPLMLQHWLNGVIGNELRVHPALRVRLAIPPNLPPVVADDGALMHVVRNILANVDRHASDGMPAELAASSPDRSTVVLEICDHGRGIAATDAERVFDVFYRAPEAVAAGSGAGLGLTAARCLVTAMGGTIAAQPRDGGGARFIVRLPAASVDEDEDGAPDDI